MTSDVSAWAVERFGSRAEELRRAVAQAILTAHELSFAAHLAGEMSSNDTYGHTLGVQQHEQLVASTSAVDGVAARKPRDSRFRFALPVLDDHHVVLFPWRYANDGKTRRQDARLPLPVSDVRKNLLTLEPRPGAAELPFDDSDGELIDPESEAEVLAEIASLGRVVTVGFASTPGLGVYQLGWGDLELVDESSGEVVWHHWETLPRSGEAGGAVRTHGSGDAPSAPVREVPRFDEGPVEDVVLWPRPGDEPAAGNGNQPS